MRPYLPICSILASLGLFAAPAQTQDKSPSSPARAAIVNGEAIPESAVARSLRRVPPEDRARARREVLDFLVDNVLIDQYLVQQKITVNKEEVDNRMAQVKKELQAAGQDYAQLLKELGLTEGELRAQIAAESRWERFVNLQATDKAMADFFAKSRDWFDGSQVRARHILVAVPPGGDTQAAAAAKAKLASLRKQIENKANGWIARLDPKADPIAREQAKTRALSEAFAEAAQASSDCPSKKEGGDLGWFPRVGSMVEPFARAAFALQPGQMSDVVETQFGCHLILVTGRMPGREVKFDDVKDEVREVYADRLRAVLIPQLRKTAKIEIN